MQKIKLDLFRLRVTFTLSSLNTNSSGLGKKSSTISNFPIFSLLYFIFFFINPLAFSPITCTYNSNLLLPIGKSNCNYFSCNFSKTVESLFICTVLNIFCNYSFGICKCILSYIKRDFMFILILDVFYFIPLKICLFQTDTTFHFGVRNLSSP